MIVLVIDGLNKNRKIGRREAVPRGVGIIGQQRRLLECQERVWLCGPEEENNCARGGQGEDNTGLDFIGLGRAEFRRALPALFRWI